MHTYRWLSRIGLLCLFVLFVWSNSNAQQAAGSSVTDLQKEVLEWQNKIKEIKIKIDKQQEEVERGKTTFSTYQKRDAIHRGSLASQVDSLRNDAVLFKRESDSVALAIESAKQGAQNYDLRRERFRETLIEFCTTLESLFTALPPSNVATQRAAVEFLKGELETRSVNESEAIERLWQLLTMLSNASQTVDVYAAPSPVTAIKGQVYYIRVGFVYLAVVKEKGEEGALWSAHADTAWQILNNPHQLAQLWNAVQVRERRAIPQLVSLPFNCPIVLDNRGTEGGDE